MPEFPNHPPLTRLVENGLKQGGCEGTKPLRLTLNKEPDSMADPTAALVCFTTVADRDQARQLAKHLLERRVAACVQIDGPVESHFEWEGKVSHEAEYRVVIKSTAQARERLRRTLREIHPYDVPQIVSLRSVDVDPDYLAWMHEQVDG
jgi:periplasmic divalent cation tolerance protein